MLRSSKRRSRTERHIHDEVIPPPIPAFSLLGSLSPFLLIPALTPAFIALFAAPNILDREPWLRYFTSWMVKIPHMDVHANSTIYPQLALLVNCLVIGAIPIIAVVVMIQTWINYPYLLRRQMALGRLALKQHLLLIFGAPLFLGLTASMIMIAGDPSWAEGYTTRSRGFYAFSAFMLTYITGVSIGMQVLNVRLFFGTRQSKGSNSEKTFRSG